MCNSANTDADASAERVYLFYFKRVLFWILRYCYRSLRASANTNANAEAVPPTG